MKRILALSFVLSSLALPALAGAQTARPGQQPARSYVDPHAADDCAQARKAGRACTLDFEGDAIGGDRPAGTGDFLDVLKTAQHTNLIRLRADFRYEIIKSAEDL
jgi:hypothetical protein